MSEYDKKSEFHELKTPEERREWIEAMHEKANGKSDFSEKSQAIRNALGGRCDKDSVLKVMAEVLGVEPVEKDGVYFFDKWEVSFDQDDRLAIMSASSGVPGMIQADVKRADDT